MTGETTDVDRLDLLCDRLERLTLQAFQDLAEVEVGSVYREPMRLAYCDVKQAWLALESAKARLVAMHAGTEPDVGW